MGNPRARYTLEFKIEAVRMVRNGQMSMSTIFDGNSAWTIGFG